MASLDGIDGWHRQMGVEVVNGMGVTVLPVCMTVVPGQNAGPARRTGWSRTECLWEPSTSGGKCVYIRHLDHGITVTSSDRAPIIGNEKQDVS